jgi:hypothetical protein
MTSAQAAPTLTASVDRTTIQVDGHVVFTLSLHNSDTRLRAEGLSPNVDLSVLSRDFDVGIPRAANRFNLSRGPDDERSGGAVSSITVELFPKRTGRHTLPVFQVNGYRSKPIAINVSAAPATDTPEILVRSGINKKTAWIGEQTIVYLELLHRVNLSTASLGGDIQTSPVRIELLDYRKLAQIERKEQIAGIAYNVQRIAWALFPNQGGTLTVRLPDLWAITEKGRRLRLPGKQHLIQVKALPVGVPADLLIGKPEINQNPLTDLPDINSVTSWNITLRAPVMDHTLPASLPGLTAPPNIKLYLDKAQRHTEENADGIISIANYTVSVTPLTAGEFHMPTITIPYFDTLRGVIDKIELPGQTLTVKSGPSSAVVASAPNTPTQKESSLPTPALLWPWQLAALIFAVLWLITLILWQHARSHAAHTRQKTGDTQISIEQPAYRGLRPLQTLLLEAFGSQSLEQGLNEWEAAHGPDQELRNTVRAVQRLYYGYGKEKTDDADLQEVVHVAITKIRAAPRQDYTAENTWSPASFTPRL